MKKKTKKFDWPRKLYDKPRIESENKLVSNYGLKNKREIWKTEAKIKYFRNRAKALITAEQEEQQIFLSNLQKVGLKVNSIAEVLSLSVEDLLSRRLSTIVHKKGLANTPKHARQMIVHKKVLVGDKMVSSPGYLVGSAEENVIKIKKKVKVAPAPKPVAAEETVVEEAPVEEAKVEENVEKKGEVTNE